MQIQASFDKTAVTLSLLCTIHCLAMPLLVSFIPSITGLFFAEEAFHLWLVFAVVPLSAIALAMGCKKHQRYRVLWMGLSGLAILLFAALAGHDLLGEVGEKGLTVIGAAIIAVGHIWNYRLCPSVDSCKCSEIID